MISDFLTKTIGRSETNDNRILAYLAVSVAAKLRVEPHAFALAYPIPDQPQPAAALEATPAPAQR